MNGFRLLRRARFDVLDIAAYTADRWGEAQAERYLTGLYSGFQTIVDRPELRRPFPEIPPYFRALVGKHAVFYRLTTDGEVLIVDVEIGSLGNKATANNLRGVLCAVQCSLQDRGEPQSRNGRAV